MATKKKATVKRGRGRPPTVEEGTNVLVYLPASTLAAIREWARDVNMRQTELLRAICVRAAAARVRRKAKTKTM